VVAEEWEERIGTVSATFLGLTVACARCHDHKHDPITSADYYALAGVFASTRLVDLPLLPAPLAARVTDARAEIATFEAKLKMLQQRKAPSDEQKREIASLQEKIQKIRSEVPEIGQPLACAVDDASLHVVGGTDRTTLLYKPREAQNV